MNTGLITVLANLVKDCINKWDDRVLTLIAMLVLFYGWWRVVSSYPQLCSCKHAVILELETLLPAAPYEAELAVLGEGRDPKRYLPLTRVETWVPPLFALLYLLLLLAVLLGGQGPMAGVWGGEIP